MFVDCVQGLMYESTDSPLNNYVDFHPRDGLFQTCLNTWGRPESGVQYGLICFVCFYALL